MTINRLTAKLSIETKVLALPTNPDDLTRATIGTDVYNVVLF
jgi:hypothetical protein